jgi:hypothetical protein
MAFGDDSATAVTVKKQLTLFVTIQVAAENIEKFKEEHRLFGPNVRGRMNVCFFDVFRDSECPGRFRFVEVGRRDREWFEKVNGVGFVCGSC